jgi:hypothetical protein
MVSLLALSGNALIVGGEVGAVDRLDLRTGQVRSVSAAPPAIAAGLTLDNADLYLVVGTRAIVTERSSEPGPPSRDLLRLPVTSDSEEVRFKLAKPVRAIDVGRTSAWLTPGPIRGTKQYVVALDGFHSNAPAVRIWNGPLGEDIVATNPDAGLALTVKSDFDAWSAVLTCWRI